MVNYTSITRKMGGICAIFPCPRADVLVTLMEPDCAVWFHSTAQICTDVLSRIGTAMMNGLRKLLGRIRVANTPILGVVASSGQVTRFAADAAADFLIALSAGVVRSLGSEAVASYLPYGNTNDQT